VDRLHEARIESRNDKQKRNDDENQTVFAHTRKIRRGSSLKRVASLELGRVEEEVLQRVFCLSSVWPLCFTVSTTEEREREATHINNIGR
jgi:hypothetical protein